MKKNSEKIIEEGIHEYEGECCNVTNLFPEELLQIAERYNVSPRKVVLVYNESENEVCIYVNRCWSGYLDSLYSYR